jgi:hypothetical protein
MDSLTKREQRGVGPMAIEEKAMECGREARKQAALLPSGPVRDALLEKARQYEMVIEESGSVAISPVYS